MPNLLDPNVCIPWGAVAFFVFALILYFTPAGQRQREINKQHTLARDKKLDEIYGRRDGL